MVAVAEQLTDLRQRQVRALAAEVHRDLSCGGDRLRAARSVEVVDRQAEVLRRCGDDVGRHDDVRVIGVDDVAQHRLGERDVEVRAVEAREGRHADERALELADVAGDLRCDVLEHLVGDEQALGLSLFAKDRDAGLEVGRLHVGDETPLEAAAHAVFEPGEVTRRHIARDHDLLVVVVQGVERVEERLLRLGLALQELDVVDHQDVDIAIAGLERRTAVVGDRVDEVVGELFARDVAHPDAGEQVDRVIADRVQQVGLAEARVAVDEQRVVGLGGGLGDGDRRRVREPVGLADDEVVEGVLRVQARVAARGRGDRVGRLVDRGPHDRHRGEGRPRLDRDRRRQMRVDQLGVDDDAEGRRGRLGVDVREGLHDGAAQALVERFGGERVRHVEVERSAHHALCDGEAQKPLHLRRDALIAVEVLEHGRPHRDIRNIVL